MKGQEKGKIDRWQLTTEKRHDPATRQQKRLKIMKISKRNKIPKMKFGKLYIMYDDTSKKYMMTQTKNRLVSYISKTKIFRAFFGLGFYGENGGTFVPPG